MRIGRRLVASLGLLTAALAGPAAAQDSGLYLGGSFGVAQYKESCQDIPLVCDDRDASWRAFAGYQFTRHLAVEAAYVDLGEITFTGNIPGVGAFDQASEVTGFDLVGVVFIPVAERLSLYGKLGAYRARVSSSIMTAGVPSSRAETSGGTTYGFGAELRFGALGIRADYQQYNNVGGQRAGEDTIDLYSIGVLLRF
jgi:OmpA-OmpF porin, OOP family